MKTDRVSKHRVKKARTQAMLAQIEIIPIDRVVTAGRECNMLQAEGKFTLSFAESAVIL